MKTGEQLFASAADLLESACTTQIEIIQAKIDIMTEAGQISPSCQLDEERAAQTKKRQAVNALRAEIQRALRQIRTTESK